MSGLNDAAHVSKLEWIDFLKGASIILVVYGHVAIIPPDRDISAFVRYIYLFHMPLFFVISGYLFKAAPLHDFAIKRVKTLIIPYASFLILLTAIIDLTHLAKGDWALIDYGTSIARLILGGTFLHLEVGVFWFLTALFFVQIIYCKLSHLLGNATDKKMLIAMAFLYVASSILSLFFDRIISPLGISAIPFGLLCFWFGNLIRNFKVGNYITPLSSGVIILWISLEVTGTHFTLDMKYSRYFPAFLIFPLSLSFVYFIILATEKYYKIIKNRLIIIFGAASLVIMALHNYVHFFLRGVGLNMDALIIIVSIFVPVLAYFSIMRFRITRFLFLGDRG
ncbi:MAG: acyltransferase family protein [Nevskia sp.]|nr:acyltransferase family protein [Nevskia sp.]